MGIPLRHGPARMDLLQSLSGLLLLLFIWGHMFFESSILLGKDAMFAVSRMFEGEFLFGRPVPALVSAAAAIVFLIIVVHAVLALRKFPASYRQYQALHGHLGRMRHADSTLWYVQVVSGYAMFFLASVHLYQVFVLPEQIGPYASADRIWSGRFWPLYALLLIAVHLHAGIGFYRMALKWNWFGAAASAPARARVKLAMWCLIAFFLTLGSVSLATYMVIGRDHAPYAGERYLPAGYQGSGSH